jgi:inositol-1,3,4-trisphosphate 5/6-kinase/inositol-tetrakisphosphate 1-kinase
VELVEIRNTDTLESLDPPEVLLFRLTEYLVSGTEDAKQLCERFSSWSQANPQVHLRDSINSQQVVTDRYQMANITVELKKALSTLQKNDIHLQVPAFTLITTSTPCPVDFPFPALLKLTGATTVSGAHVMYLVQSASSLSNLVASMRDQGDSRKYILQEFVNHDATIFKIFVLGKSISVVSRVSLPNLPFSALPADEILKMDSQEWKHSLPAPYTTSETGKKPPPPQEHLEIVSSALSRITGLTMFGYDVICNSSTGSYAVVDINYLPDYVGVEDFPALLLEHLLAT